MQQILIITTVSDSVRSEAISWVAEDGNAAIGMETKPVEYISWFKQFHSFSTVLHAMGDGWFVMAPPHKEENNTWKWWLFREY